MELLLHTAPEVLLRGEAPGQKADVYALGTLLWEVRHDEGSGLHACWKLGSQPVTVAPWLSWLPYGVCRSFFASP